jgi:hypothetical protein
LRYESVPRFSLSTFTKVLLSVLHDMNSDQFGWQGFYFSLITAQWISYYGRVESDYGRVECRLWQTGGVKTTPNTLPEGARHVWLKVIFTAVSEDFVQHSQVGEVGWRTYNTRGNIKNWVWRFQTFPALANQKTSFYSYCNLFRLIMTNTDQF